MTNDTARDQDCWWKFTGYNRQAMYGAGSEREAERYCDWLNEQDGDRYGGVNVLHATRVTDQDTIDMLNNGDEGVNLNDALRVIDGKA